MEVKEAQAIPYTRVVEPGEDGVFTARLVELPGAIAEGETSVEALASLERLLPDFFDVMIEEGLEFPPAMSRKAHSGEIKLRMTPAAHAHAELVASVEGVSINRVLSDAVAKYVGMRPADGVKRARSVAKSRSATPAPRRAGAGPAQPAAKNPASKSPTKRRPIARRVGGTSPKA